jgi:hypothetical protein
MSTLIVNRAIGSIFCFLLLAMSPATRASLYNLQSESSTPVSLALGDELDNSDRYFEYRYEFFQGGFTEGGYVRGSFTAYDRGYKDGFDTDGYYHPPAPYGDGISITQSGSFGDFLDGFKIEFGGNALFESFNINPDGPILGIVQSLSMTPVFRLPKAASMGVEVVYDNSTTKNAMFYTASSSRGQNRGSLSTYKDGQYLDLTTTNPLYTKIAYTSVPTSVGTVPLPNAIYLFISGLIWLVANRRKQAP